MLNQKLGIEEELVCTLDVTMLNLNQKCHDYLHDKFDDDLCEVKISNQVTSKEDFVYALMDTILVKFS